MEQGMEMLFALFGGLAMFLYGMDRMSRALQRAAGDAMKRLLARLTATPLLGVLTGLAVPAVLQSSSAATVMVIGFVSAGLLELPRAVAVIYGINIGTTMTAQLIAFDAQQHRHFGPGFAAAGRAGGLSRLDDPGEGVAASGHPAGPLHDHGGAEQFGHHRAAAERGPAGRAGRHPQHAGPCRGGAGPSGRQRAALAHSCFNLSGSLLAAVLLPWFVRLVELISPKGPELEVISRQIANAHTTFNVCCALLWLPFCRGWCGWSVRWCRRSSPLRHLR